MDSKSIFADELRRRMIFWRQHLHAHPELSTCEASTADFIAGQLSQLGIPYECNVGGHGIVASLQRPGSSRRVGLRADMDALPIHEQTNLAYASRVDGVMHACGHDGHTASLLGAAHMLIEDPDWSGTIRFVFQPAEEQAIGAKAMIERDFFEKFPVDSLYAYHNWPGLAVGTIAAISGPVMAASARIAIKITGKAGHAAMPHQSRDPLLAAGHLLTALQSISSRAIDPMEAVVVSITTLKTGVAFNQIPDVVTLGGTMRALTIETRDRIETEIERICHGIGLAFGLEVELDLRRTVPPTVNHPEAAETAARAAGAVATSVIRNLKPSLAAEDFAYFLSHRPGAMVWIGNGEDAAGQELHSPTYDFNDDILPIAAGWFAEVAKLDLRAHNAAPPENIAI